MRGRLAIPVHDLEGRLIAYCGQTVSNETPELIFPNGFNPCEVIFNAHRVKGSEDGELILARDPLEVMPAHEAGITNVVSFLTGTIRAEQLDRLSSLMDTLCCEQLHIA